MTEDQKSDTEEGREEADHQEIEDLSYLTYRDVVEEQSDKAKEYHDINIKIELFSTIFDIMLIAALVILGYPNFLRNSSPFGSSYSLPTVAFVSVAFILTITIISLPISYYQERVERRFEFATRSDTEWAKDKIKELGIGLVIFTVLIEAIFSALDSQPDLWWIYAFFGYFVFAGVLSSLSPFLISIFTKIESMEEGEIRSTVENIAKEMNLTYDDIYSWNMSQQTTKANAAVTGFGKTIRIMLGDTLTENFRPDEIEIVMAHEIAHQKNKDVYRSILFNGVIALVAFYLVDLGFGAALDLFDLTGKSDPAAIGYFFLGMTIALQLLGKISLWYSRRREKAADIVAIDVIRNLEVFESAFARLSKQNLSFPNPSKLEVLWRYSHPPIKDRIAYAERYFGGLNS